jgi:hypothetical protein
LDSRCERRQVTKASGRTPNGRRPDTAELF